jgi:sigma-B regulation protein RsbU (phosphoserine phosphatase)
MRTIGTAMKERIEVDSVLDYVVGSLVDSTAADAGVVYLRNTGDHHLSVRSERGHFPPPYHVSPSVRSKVGGVDQYLRATPIAVGEGIFGEAVEQNLEIRLEDASVDHRFQEIMEDRASTITSIYAVPIQVGSEARGLLSIATTTPKKYLGRQDWDRCKVFATYCSLMLESLFNYLQLLEKQEMEQEVDIAASIQRGLLPRSIPEAPGMEVYSYTAAARGVSGDYYDLEMEESGRLFGLVCDVAGKGIPASLIMVIIRTIVHMERRGSYTLSTLLSLINEGISGDLAVERFATACIFTYDPESGEVVFANGGHHPALVFRAREGRFEELDTPGIPVGIEASTVYEETSTHLEPGDLVILYTDGILEAENTGGERFREQRLRRAILQRRDSGAREIVAGIIDAVDSFVGTAPQHDDQTLIVLKATE